MVDYKIEIVTNFTGEQKRFVVRLLIDGENYEDFHVDTITEAGKIALYYETFFKYYKQE